MTKRALLIGSQTGGLVGTHNDVQVMADCLAQRAFEVRTVEQEATRDGIIAAYNKLISDSGAGDAAFVYYSGHGGAVRNPGAGQPGQLPHLHYIQPLDIEDMTGDFRGILAEELSLLQWRLTNKTHNVTVMLDCCHSARMSRGLSLRPRARGLAIPWEVIRARWQEVQAAPEAGQMHGDSNPYAVRLTACGFDQSAFEQDFTPLGAAHGVLTVAFVMLLRELGDQQVTWKTLVERLRPQVLADGQGQRPEAEGPVSRLLFSMQEQNLTGVLPVLCQDDRFFLEAAAFYGIEPGDQYAIVPGGKGLEQKIATGTVTELEGSLALLQLDVTDPMPAGVEARPLKVSLGMRPVAVLPEDHANSAKVKQLLTRSSHLRLAGAIERVLATVRLSDNEYELFDPEGEPYGVKNAMSDENLNKLAANLEKLARAAHLRELESGTGNSWLAAPIEVRWVRLRPGLEEPLENKGSMLFNEDQVRLYVRNQSHEVVWVSVFDVGLRGMIAHFTKAAPSGYEIQPGDEFIFPRNPAGQPGNITLYWPGDLPPGRPRPETFVLIFTDQPQDLRALAQTGVQRGVLKAAGPISGLQVLLNEVVQGTRDGRISASPVQTVQYRVARLEFLLNPTRSPDLAEPAFSLDERPDISLRLLRPRDATPPPQKVAVRLRDLVVLRNRALFSANIRVDTLAITRPAGTNQPVYSAATAFFPAIGAGDRLPFDALRIFNGPVHDFLDLAIWVSRDDHHGRDLSELLAQESGRTEVAEALSLLASLAIGGPVGVGALGAIGAIAILIRTGARLLDAATTKSIGVYRHSLLPHERFGEGRHPAQGLLNAQDMSLSYEIVSLD